MFKFGKRSSRILETVDPKLKKLAYEVIKYRDCAAISGYRDEEEQTRLYNTILPGGGRLSYAQFGESPHNKFLSEALDLVPYPTVWDNKESFIEFAGFVLGIAAMLGIKLHWGGHFKKFFDGPHYELDV